MLASCQFRLRLLNICLPQRNTGDHIAPQTNVWPPPSQRSHRAWSIGCRSCPTGRCHRAVCLLLGDGSYKATGCEPQYIVQGSETTHQGDQGDGGRIGWTEQCRNEIWTNAWRVDRWDMIVRENLEFTAARCADFAEVDGEYRFRTASFASLVVEPRGRMAMPPTHVTTGASGDYRIQRPWITLPDGKLPAFVAFPKMMLTSLENAYCLPFGPPILLSQRQIITDFLVPWGLGSLAWFAHSGGKVYHTTRPCGQTWPRDECIRARRSRGNCSRSCRIEWQYAAAP